MSVVGPLEELISFSFILLFFYFVFVFVFVFVLGRYLRAVVVMFWIKTVLETCNNNVRREVGRRRERERVEGERRY